MQRYLRCQRMQAPSVRDVRPLREVSNEVERLQKTNIRREAGEGLDLAGGASVKLRKLPPNLAELSALPKNRRFDDGKPILAPSKLALKGGKDRPAKNDPGVWNEERRAQWHVDGAARAWEVTNEHARMERLGRKRTDSSVFAPEGERWR